MPPKAHRKMYVNGVELHFENAGPTQTPAEALQESLLLEAAFNLMTDEEKRAVDNHPEVPILTPEEVVILDSYLNDYNNRIRACNFPLEEEQDYILRFRQVTNSMLVEVECELDTATEHHKSQLQWIPIVQKLEEMNNTLLTHPEKNTGTFAESRNSLIENIAIIGRRMDSIKDTKMRGMVDKVIRPVVERAERRNGVARSVRERWDELSEMVDRVMEEKRIVADWDEFLDGIPNWYRPVFFQNGLFR